MSSSMADLVYGQLPVLPSVTMDNRTVCTGASATFSAYATNGTSPYQYSWNGGGYTSTSTLTISPASSSANEIVIVKDANGCLSIPDTAQLTVTAVPTVNAIANKTYCNGNAGSAISFSGPVAGTTFTWSGTSNVGFGTTGSGNIAAFTATNAGSTPLVDVVTVTPSTSGCSGTATTFTVTVNPSPAAGTFTGTERYCVGASVTYTATVTGGSWSSSATSVVTVNATGVATGIAQGTAKITYTVNNSCGSAYTTKGVTINPLPVAGAISGTASMCAGTTVTLTHGTSSGDGAWTSSSSAIASVNTIGVVTGVNVGTATISFTATNSCGSAYATQVVTVNPLPAPGTITGSESTCVGSTITLTDAAAGGTWTSASVGIATVNATGIVTGIAQRTARISYAVTNSCGTAYATRVVAINPLPNAGTIGGTAVTCVGASTTLTRSVDGGSWSSSSTATATVSATGLVAGVAAGTATISFSVTNTCGTAVATRVVTVNPMPNAGTITGAANACIGSPIALTDAAGGGEWSSSAVGIATVSATGVVTGIAQGTATISYTVTNSCGTAKAIKAITVNPMPNAGAITGVATACAGSATTLTNAAGGGVWTSDATGIATVGAPGSLTGATGVVTGVAAGTATISYTVANSCGTANATRVVTINPLPNAGTITGTVYACAGSTTALTNASNGGSWTSASSSVATVNAAGVITGVAQGTATISYTVTNSCGTANATTLVTINPLPNAGAITGTTYACAGSATTLANVSTSGSWTSASTGIATVDAAGVVSGVAQGTATISYTVTNSCGTANATTLVTINPLPNAGTITGTTYACAGSATTLANVSTSGSWTSASTDIATVDAAGVVSGVAQGTATISYTVTNSCGTANATRVVTINPLPNAGAITGTTYTCAGSATTLANASNGGSWTSASTDIATVDGAGVVTGVAQGTATILYTVTNSCGTANATTLVTINPLPNAGTITGTTYACAGSATTLTNAATSGSWNSASTDIATVDAAGVVSGVAQGTAAISYTVTNSCGTANATTLVTINPLPDAGTITGTTNVCVGAVITLIDAAIGAEWSSNATGVATVDASGNVTGVAAGTATISYTVTNSCGIANTSKVITVNPLPNAGATPGVASVCAGSATTLTAVVSGGVWSSDATDVATVDATGVVTGVNAGTAHISYTVTNSCGVANVTRVIIVNPLPSAGAIPGVASVCVGSVIALAAAATGGVWSSEAAATATIDASGNVTGIAEGTANISYTVTNSCGVANATRLIVVNPLPVAGTITGIASACAGSATTLSAAIGGVWSSDATGTATIDASGVVTAIAAGTTTISYTVTNGCGVANTAKVVTVNPLPNAGAITGTTVLCAGTTAVLGNAVTGGVWSSPSASIASVSAGGVLTGAAAGTASISYTVTNGCGTAVATSNVIVNNVPAVGAITGAANVCAGSVASLTNSATGGVWTSSSTGIATISASGVVTANTAGTTTISYTVTNSCGVARTTKTVTVNAVPNAGTITGAATICAATSRSLSNTVTGGAWTSAAPSVATVNASGVVTGVAGGVATISYTLSNSSCSTSAVTAMTINPLPYVSAIMGSTHVRYNADTTLTDSVAGGTWTASNVNVTVTGGLVRGVHPGTVTISYSLTNSCGTNRATKSMTVDSPRTYVSAIAGASFLPCVGSSILYSSGTSGGVFSIAPSDTGVAKTTIAGLVTGISVGTATLSYTYMGSTVTSVLTVYPTPAAITGPGYVCAGQQITLSDPTPGGVWTSGIPATATIGAAEGIVTATNAGVVPMYYKLLDAGGCRVQFNVTVNPNPSGIAGSSAVCVGAVISLSNATPGGTWSGTNDHASIDVSGHVTGISVGGVDFTYTLGTGCFSTRIIGINASPTQINGNKAVCAGLVTFLSDASTTAMSWTSSTPAVATISASGAVTGVTAGTTTITFKVTTGCYTTTVVTVNAVPTVTAILGASSVSTSAPVPLSDLTPGGVWTSDHASIITVGSSTGILTAVTASGSATIKYMVTNSFGCSASVTKPVTACATAARKVPTTTTNTTTTVGSAIDLSANVAGGEWTSSDEMVATVDANGVVTATAEGNVTITHLTADADGQVSTEITNVVINQQPIEANLAPNPNKGSFVVKGTTGTPYDATVSYQITNMAGQIMYRNSDFATGGVINQSFNLNSNFTTGTYILIVTCGDQRKSFNFVVE